MVATTGAARAATGAGDGNVAVGIDPGASLDGDAPVVPVSTCIGRALTLESHMSPLDVRARIDQTHANTFGAACARGRPAQRDIAAQHFSVVEADAVVTPRKTGGHRGARIATAQNDVTGGSARQRCGAAIFANIDAPFARAIAVSPVGHAATGYVAASARSLHNAARRLEQQAGARQCAHDRAVDLNVAPRRRHTDGSGHADGPQAQAVGIAERQAGTAGHRHIARVVIARVVQRDAARARRQAGGARHGQRTALGDVAVAGDTQVSCQAQGAQHQAVGVPQAQVGATGRHCAGEVVAGGGQCDVAAAGRQAAGACNGQRTGLCNVAAVGERQIAGQAHRTQDEVVGIRQVETGATGRHRACEIVASVGQGDAARASRETGGARHRQCAALVDVAVAAAAVDAQIAADAGGGQADLGVGLQRQVARCCDVFIADATAGRCPLVEHRDVATTDVA